MLLNISLVQVCFIVSDSKDAVNYRGKKGHRQEDSDVICWVFFKMPIKRRVFYLHSEFFSFSKSPKY